MSFHPDPTANRALGSVEREWKKMAALALAIRESDNYYERLYAEGKRFTGIFKSLLTCPIEQLRPSGKKAA